MVANSIILIMYLGTIILLFVISSLKFKSMVANVTKKLAHSISSLKVGEVSSFYGSVQLIDSTILHSQYGHIACVGFVSRIDQKIKNVFSALFKPNTLVWHNIGENSNVVPFLIKDDTGTICVLATCSQIHLPKSICGEIDVHHVFKPIGFGLRWFYRLILPKNTLWVSESLLRKEDFVCVTGMIRKISLTDKHRISPRIYEITPFIVKGGDVVITAVHPHSQIIFYEKCMRFCQISAIISTLILIVLLIPPF